LKDLGEVSADDALKMIRNSVMCGRDVATRKEGEYFRVAVKGGFQFKIRRVPDSLVIGLDLRNYSGLSDLGQFTLGVKFPFLVEKAFKSSRLYKRHRVGESGTGDGAIIALDTIETRLWQAVLFGALLWIEGRDIMKDRGLRVALTSGPCVVGREFAGSMQMQGYGLVEASRILGCDKRTHLLISYPLWKALGPEKDVRATEGSYGGYRLVLNRTRTIFHYKIKPGDRHELCFVNCHGHLRLTHGSMQRFGMISERGLKRPKAGVSSRRGRRSSAG
jgi:hypothetical protein